MNTGTPWDRIAKFWIHTDQGPRGRSQNLGSRFFHEERRYQKRPIDKARPHLVLTTRVKFSMGKASKHLGEVVAHISNPNTREDYKFKASLGCIARPHLTYVRVCARMYTCVLVHLSIQHLRKQQRPVCRGSYHSENVERKALGHGRRENYLASGSGSQTGLCKTRRLQNPVTGRPRFVVLNLPRLWLLPE